jgi:hypothetical protein
LSLPEFFNIRYRSLIYAACRKSTRMTDLGAIWQGSPGEYGGKAALTAEISDGFFIRRAIRNRSFFLFTELL